MFLTIKSIIVTLVSPVDRFLIKLNVVNPSAVLPVILLKSCEASNSGAVYPFIHVSIRNGLPALSTHPIMASV